jgi:hypothetical protein
MKKTFVAAIAIVAALLIVLAAVRIALVQYQSPASSGSGNLAVMGTDPPVAANGVSQANAHYNSVQAHKAGTDMSSGWTQVSGSGTLNLMASGQAQVMASSQVDAATYDAFKFNVDSVNEVYHGQAYTATVASSTISATSQNKVHVNSSSSASALVDIKTFIQNTGSSSNPQFVFSATAYATGVPAQASTSLSLQVGTNVDLAGQAWFSSFEAQTTTNLSVVTATLTSGSLTLNLQNSGGANGQVQEIIITPVSASTTLSAYLPDSYSGSAVFAVSGSGSIQQTSSLQASTLSSAGAVIASGSTDTLTYNGNISMSGSIQSSGVVSGQQYVITCIGANTYASTTVVAS